jgi:hypothetical protein
MEHTRVYDRTRFNSLKYLEKRGNLPVETKKMRQSAKQVRVDDLKLAI